MDIIVNESDNNPNFLDSCPDDSVLKFCGVPVDLFKKYNS